MGTTERKEREKERRKIDIIDAAENVFFSKGFDKATMDDIAKEAELGKGTLYLYFNSKEELLEEISARGMQILLNLFIKATDIEDLGILKVRKIGIAFTEFYTKYPNFYKAFIIDQGKQSSEELLDISLSKSFALKFQVMELFAKTIKFGIDDGSINANLEPQKTAIILWAQLSGVLYLLENKGNMIKKIFSFSEEEIQEYFYEFCYNALKA